MRIAPLFVLLLASPRIGLCGSPLRGNVTDVEGAAIPGAMVLIHWDSAGSTVGLSSNVGIKKDLTVKADEKGIFTVELPPGFYDVFVSAMAFTPACRKIRVGAAPPKELTFHLNVDPLVGKELGTEIKPSVRKP